MFAGCSDDEPAAYWRALTDAVRCGRWRADDGHDYGAHLGRVRPPLLQVVSDGDRLLAAPDDALAFTAEVPRREVLRLGKGCTVPALRGLAPGHVEMVAHPRCLPLWRHVARWCVEALTDPTRGASSQG